ncbi:MAG: hypothetical protein ACRDJP_01675, partial [Actinomycetota bacterium]
FWTGPTDRDLANTRRWHEEQRWRYRQLGEHLARRLGNRGHVALLAPDRIVWWEEGANATGGDEGWLTRRGGGHIEEIRMTTGSSGREALDRAVGEGILGEPGSDAKRAPAADELVRSFHKRFRSGLAITVGSASAATSLSADDRRAVFADAMRFARDFGRGRSGHDVSAFCVDGEILHVFVVPPGTPPWARVRWRRLVSAATIAASLRPDAHAPRTPAAVS